MTFDQVFPYLKQNKKITRKDWDRNCCLFLTENGKYSNLVISMEDLLADDWTIRELNFAQAINALLDGKHIVRAYDLGSRERYICLRGDKLYKGLGCCGVKEYRFSKEDVYAEDWIIIE